MSNERVDLTQYDERIARANDPYTSLNSPDEDGEDIEVLVAELKRCYEEIDALRSITQDWVKIETFTDDGKDLSVDMEDSDGNCFSGYINRASE